MEKGFGRHSFRLSVNMSGRVYVINSPILTAYGEWRFEGPLSPERARSLLESGFESSVGHGATAGFLTQLLGVDIPENRSRIMMQPGDRALVLRLTSRIEEGRVLSAAELEAIPYELGLLTRLS